MVGAIAEYARRALHDDTFALVLFLEEVVDGCRLGVNRHADRERPCLRSVAFSSLSLATGIVAVGPAAARASVTLDGSFSTAFSGRDFAGLCPSGVADECGTMQLVGLGAADWAYVFGPTFEPNGRCFDVDGTLTITLQSDGSMISGPLTGVFCPRPSATGHQHGGAISNGNPWVEDDGVVFTDGTGQFDGLSGAASFHTFFAGARFKGTLKGTLSGSG